MTFFSLEIFRTDKQTDKQTQRQGVNNTLPKMGGFVLGGKNGEEARLVIPGQLPPPQNDKAGRHCLYQLSLVLFDCEWFFVNIEVWYKVSKCGTKTQNFSQKGNLNAFVHPYFI